MEFLKDNPIIAYGYLIPAIIFFVGSLIFFYIEDDDWEFKVKTVQDTNKIGLTAILPLIGISFIPFINFYACLNLLLQYFQRSTKAQRERNFNYSIQRIKKLIQEKKFYEAQSELGRLSRLALPDPYADIYLKTEMEVDHFISTYQKEEQEKKEQKRKEYEEESRKQREELVKRVRSMKMLETITPYEFELVILEAFRRSGYAIHHTSFSGDEGIDGLLTKGNSKIAIQCKMQKKVVGQPALRDFLGAMIHSQCTEGFFITTSDFSERAKSFSKGKNIRLMNQQATLDLLRSTINEDYIMNGRTIINFS